MNSQLSQPIPGSGPADAYDPSVEPAGLGVRTIGSDTFSGELLDVLRLTPDLGAPAAIEQLVRDRCARFGSAPVTGLAAVLRVERAFDGRLEVWSRRAEGFRVSAVLEWTEARGIASSLEAALTIGDRLLAALASLQALDNAAGASGHGAIAIDQVVVNETGQLTLTDYAFGTVLAGLQWPRERLWRRFRIAMPPAAGLARFDHRVDVTQAALVISALMAGRLFRAEEYPRSLAAIVAEAVRRSCGGAGREDRGRLTAWLRAATELESRNAFASAAAARKALRHVLGDRLDDTDAVRRWLRAARALAEPATGAQGQDEDPFERASAIGRPTATEPEAQTPPPAAAAASNPTTPFASRLRQWISPR